MEIKTTNKELRAIIDRGYSCLANKTTSVVNNLKYNIGCADDITCLHALILFIFTLERWQQYGDGRAKDDNCITLEEKTKIVDLLMKTCPASCAGTASTEGNINVLEFLTEARDYILVQ